MTDQHPNSFDPSDIVDDSSSLESMVQQYIDEYQEFLSWLGTTVEHVGDGTASIAVPYDEKLTNVRPSTGANRRPDMHGGVAATLIDTAGGVALRTELEDPFTAPIATINLNVNYLRPATGDLTATAAVVRAGSSVGVSEITVESRTDGGETTEVATGQASYRIFQDR